VIPVISAVFGIVSPRKGLTIEVYQLYASNGY
jgi:hypothetical protein